MADTISRIQGPGARSRYGPSPVTASDSALPVEPAAGLDSATSDEHHDGEDREDHEAHQPRLEVTEDQTGELIYRIIDPQTGGVVRSWDNRDLGRLRDYLLQHHMHLIDRSI